MIRGVGHVGIAVKNIEESLEAVSRALDLPIPQVRDFPEKKMKCAVVGVGGIGLEFIEDYSEEGAFATFVKERGNAIHHVCLLTDDIEADIKVLEKRGVEMADQEPRIGLRGKKIAFTRPSALKGIPMELSEP
jgi:methylmalonyl-CoA/ethylmalonyl-CoA epimerase